MVYLKEHPEIKHGKIRVGFNPDEEIGLGAHKFDVERFGCEWAYTMDGGEVGELEFENFNAASAKVIIKGRDGFSAVFGAEPSVLGLCGRRARGAVSRRVAHQVLPCRR